MVAPSGEGAVRCMELALAGFDGKAITDKVTILMPRHINTSWRCQGTGCGREVFGPRLSADRDIHKVTDRTFAWCDGRAGSHLYNDHDERGLHRSLGKYRKPRLLHRRYPVPSERVDGAAINLALSNSFGFGGTNATLAWKV